MWKIRFNNATVRHYLLTPLSYTCTSWWYADKHPLLTQTCLSLLPPCSLLGDTETSPWGAKKQTAHDFWPGHESCSWTTGAASTRGKRELSFGECNAQTLMFFTWALHHCAVFTGATCSVCCSSILFQHVLSLYANTVIQGVVAALKLNKKGLNWSCFWSGYPLAEEPGIFLWIFGPTKAWLLTFSSHYCWAQKFTCKCKQTWLSSWQQLEQRCRRWLQWKIFKNKKETKVELRVEGEGGVHSNTLTWPVFLSQ